MTQERCWPVILADMTQFRVVNLAQPGATVKSAMAQSKGIAESGSLVIVEIGGNDLLGGTDASDFMLGIGNAFDLFNLLDKL